MNRRSLPWMVTAISLTVAAALLLGRRMQHAGEHPDPRVGITAASVVPAASYAPNEMAVRAYEAAAQAPQVLDGLYCYCQCKRNLDHRSLLTCFENDHGSQCDICIGEAFLAARMHAQGRSLDEIRRAVDADYGS